MPNHLLFVEDDASLNEVFARLLEKNDFTVDACLDGKSALTKTETGIYDAALVDVNLGAVSGFEILRALKKQHPHVPVVMITAYSNVNDAVHAMKEGAYDYITKPIKEKEIVLILKNAIASAKPVPQMSAHQSSEPHKMRHSLIGESPAMVKLKETMARIAATEANVFISGETGTGKEIIAQMLHDNSTHAAHPFIAVNCAAIPESLFESELYGHGKGAFTGAENVSKGKFELAGDGTIFLDEITEMPLPLQAKLLRVIQEKEIEPLGTGKKIHIGARFIAASNRDIGAEIGRGRFREDLYFRLNVMPIAVPPLRERRTDIPLLVRHCIAEFRLAVLAVDADAMSKAMEYHWPGNVRELENVIQYAALSCGNSTITIENLPDKIRNYTPETLSSDETSAQLSGEMDKTLSAQERALVIEALKKYDGNQSKAAKSLGISRAQLIYRMKKLSIRYSVEIH